MDTYLHVTYSSFRANHMCMSSECATVQSSMVEMSARCFTGNEPSDAHEHDSVPENAASAAQGGALNAGRTRDIANDSSRQACHYCRRASRVLPDIMAIR